jgi:hypothetical protein
VPDELVDVQMLFYEHYADDKSFIAKLQKGFPKETLKIQYTDQEAPV